MGTSAIITCVLVALIVLSLPNWGYSKNWGGTFFPPVFLGAVLAAHFYTVLV